MGKIPLCKGGTLTNWVKRAKYHSPNQVIKWGNVCKSTRHRVVVKKNYNKSVYKERYNIAGTVVNQTFLKEKKATLQSKKFIIIIKKIIKKSVKVSWWTDKKIKEILRGQKIKYKIFDLEIPLVEIYYSFTYYKSKKSYIGRINKFKTAFSV